MYDVYPFMARVVIPAKTKEEIKKPEKKIRNDVVPKPKKEIGALNPVYKALEAVFWKK